VRDIGVAIVGRDLFRHGWLGEQVEDGKMR
jgi:hypothetical protein